MNVYDLLENMSETLSRLYLCKNCNNDVVNRDIDSAIMYFERFLANNGCNVSYNNVNYWLDDVSLYESLLLSASDIQMYNSLFTDNCLVGTWWNICTAINELEISSDLIKGYIRKRKLGNQIIL